MQQLSLRPCSCEHARRLGGRPPSPNVLVVDGALTTIPPPRGPRPRGRQKPPPSCPAAWSMLIALCGMWEPLRSLGKTSAFPVNSSSSACSLTAVGMLEGGSHCDRRAPRMQLRLALGVLPAPWDHVIQSLGSPFFNINSSFPPKYFFSLTNHSPKWPRKSDPLDLAYPANSML